MQLPILWPDIPGQKFECRACTRCCRELVVHLTHGDREKIDRQKWGGRLAAEPYVRLGNSYVLNHKRETAGGEGGCIFLMDDGRCRIHAEYGRTEKPLACQLYPFTVEAGATGVQVGLRYDCPTTAASAGLPLPTHRQDIKRIAVELQDAGALGKISPADSIEVAHGVRIAPAAADQFVEHVKRWLRSERHSLNQRLIGLERLAHTLSEAKLNRLAADAAAELVVMLAGGVEELSRDETVAIPREPSAREMRLFRQAVFSHCEHATFSQMFLPLVATVRHRWGQLVRAQRMSRGVGLTPVLTGMAGSADFEIVDRVVPGSDSGLAEGNIESLLTRYLLARFESRTAFGAGYYGWSIADGFGALLLAVACAGWLARLHAAVEGRETFGRADAERAIAIVDRAAGRSPELGARSAQLRVRYLEGASAIPALLAKYRMSPSAVK